MLHSFSGLRGSQVSYLMRTANAATYSTVSITSGGTIGTYGASWTQVIASSAFDATGIRVHNTQACSNAAARGDVAAIVGVGGSGSEVQKVGPLLFGGRNNHSSYTLPIFIPKGSRICLKTAAGVTSRAINFVVELLGSPNRDMDSLPTSWVAYGTNVSSGVGAYGTIHAPGATNTWSSWTQIATSTRAHSLWMPMAALGTATVANTFTYRSQFALGSTADAASMLTSLSVFEPPWVTTDTSERLGKFATATNPIDMGYEQIIYAPRPSGAGMSVRALCTSTPDANLLSLAFLAAVK